MLRRKTSNSNRHKLYYRSGKPVDRLVNIIENAVKENSHRSALQKNRERDAKELRDKEQSNKKQE